MDLGHEGTFITDTAVISADAVTGLLAGNSLEEPGISPRTGAGPRLIRGYCFSSPEGSPNCAFYVPSAFELCDGADQV